MAILTVRNAPDEVHRALPRCCDHDEPPMD